MKVISRHPSSKHLSFQGGTLASPGYWLDPSIALGDGRHNAAIPATLSKSGGNITKYIMPKYFVELQGLDKCAQGGG